MELLTNILNFPLPRYTLQRAYVIALFVCFIYNVVFFNVFDIGGYFGFHYTPIHAFFASVIFSSCEILLIYFTPIIFKNYSKVWNVQSEIFFYKILTILITSACSLTVYLFSLFELNLFVLGKIVLLVLYKGIFPVLLLMIVKFYFITSVLKDKVHGNHQDISNYKVDLSSGLIIQLKGKNKFEEIEIIEKDLIYIHSEDNYICIYYLKNNIIHKEVFRTTLSEIESQLSAFKNFYRCHRCYIINAMMVKGIVGNARAYKLIMDKVSDEIPLGMKYFNDISEITSIIEEKLNIDS